VPTPPDQELQSGQPDHRLVDQMPGGERVLEDVVGPALIASLTWQ
jgi:hypothetical protein